MLLQTIDEKWREHLLRLEHLRSVVGFRGYAQRDPLNEYKTEAFQLFETMLDSLRQEVTQKLSQIRPMTEEEQQAMLQEIEQQRAAMENAAEAEKTGQVIQEASENGADRFDESDPSTGATPAATSPAPAARARSSSIATAALPDRRGHNDDGPQSAFFT